MEEVGLLPLLLRAEPWVAPDVDGLFLGQGLSDMKEGKVKTTYISTGQCLLVGRKGFLLD